MSNSVFIKNLYTKCRIHGAGDAQVIISDQEIYALIVLTVNNLKWSFTELGIKKGPDVPSGVMARQIDENHFLYLNVSGEAKQIQQKGNSRSLLFDKDYKGNFILAPYEPEFIETK